jgi:hypothetical protein
MLLGTGTAPGSSYVLVTYFSGEVVINSGVSGYMFSIRSVSV